MSQAGVINFSAQPVPPSVATLYVEDVGAAVPAANTLNVFGSLIPAGATPVHTTGAGNTVTIDVQTSQAIASSNVNNVGLAAFDSENFSVDANGFVSILNPNKLLTLSEDFLSGLTRFTAAGTQQSGTATNPGIIQLSPSPLSQEIFANDNVVHSFAMGGGIFKFNTVLDLATLSNGVDRYIVYFGMQNNIPSASPPPDGIYFSYTDNVNAGNWTLNCSNTSVTTSVDSGVPAGIGFVNLGFTVNAAGTSVTFTINGASVGTIVTNIPTVAMSPQLLWFPIIGNTPNSITDLIYLSYLLTTAR